MPDIALTYIGGPTALLEYGGVRFLTDPTFDAPQTYEPRNGFAHTKTHGPALAPSELGAVDLALVSHHHHGDNLDILGAALLRDLPLTISTTKAAEDLGGTVVGLEPWASVQVGKVTITAVPALHGPPGSEGRGPVIGFVLRTAEAPSVYVSGDNASLPYVKSIAERFGKIDISLLFAGAARIPVAEGELTLSSADAVLAAGILASDTVVGLHTEDWAHLTESREDFRRAFAGEGRYVETPRAHRVILRKT
ncbi:MBL fold metallo-hydrolase [Streptosporangium lutulentum]|uniref:L-ascorbate metabolism protein UlaG (Beta-lactamase superfamily) n=1 Tax=Streptosporangium lutulentum TaxID=1461250 RepID=A0ABT9Q458_9ACTN|nr:MBL fold metallo-hydrolase [Streptosporangium lutulentum]MDP9841514.1 L-ascorbate metabolism protein UlaG (beta-lactamase superfamily) [Streptosporangium lutulentum]